MYRCKDVLVGRAALSRLLPTVSIVALLAVALVSPPTLQASSVSSVLACEFRFGFKTLHDLIPDIIGACVEQEHHNPETGDAVQHTTRGLLVWQKDTNIAAFTDGHHTWSLGPFGLQRRLNTEWFAWEPVNDDLLPPAAPGQPVIRSRQVDLAWLAAPVRSERGWLQLLYAVASDGQPESLIVHDGIVYAAEASAPAPLVSWRLRDGANARSYTFPRAGASNSAPLARADGRRLLSAHAADQTTTITVSELPALQRVCSVDIPGWANVEGFSGWDLRSSQFAWYRTESGLFRIESEDCSLVGPLPLGAPYDFVIPSQAPDGTWWTSFRSAESEDVLTARIDPTAPDSIVCTAPVGHGGGYGTPVIVPSSGDNPDRYSVIVAGNDGIVSRIASDCGVVWSRPVLRTRPGAARYGLVHQGPAVSEAQGLVYIGDNGTWSLPPGPDAGSVIALAIADGREVWRWQQSDRLQAFAPFLVGGYLFVRSYDPASALPALPPRLTILDAATGQALDAIELAPPSEPGAWSGPISAKLLCTPGACIIASARGTSQPGWWFVVAFNDLAASEASSVPYNGNVWNQNAIQPQLYEAGYYANGAVIWNSSGGFRYERIPLGSRLADRERIVARPNGGEVAVTLLVWNEPADGARLGAEDQPALVARLRLVPGGSATEVELRFNGLPAGRSVLLATDDAPSHSQHVSLRVDGMGSARTTVPLSESRVVSLKILPAMH